MAKLTQEQLNKIKNAKTKLEAFKAYRAITDELDKVYDNWEKPKGAIMSKNHIGIHTCNGCPKTEIRKEQLDKIKNAKRRDIAWKAYRAIRDKAEEALADWKEPKEGK